MYAFGQRTGFLFLISSIVLRAFPIRSVHCRVWDETHSQFSKMPTLRTFVRANNPLLFAMSFDPRFQASYPYLRPEWYHTGAIDQPYFFLHLCVWEIFSSAHLLALEFFFRGFMLWGIWRSIGSKAIVFAAVPYCMIHFGKPIEEVVVSFFAGIVLGALSIRSGSILPGAILHVAFALTMDVFVLINR